MASPSSDEMDSLTHGSSSLCLIILAIASTPDWKVCRARRISPPRTFWSISPAPAQFETMLPLPAHAEHFSSHARPAWLTLPARPACPWPRGPRLGGSMRCRTVCYSHLEKKQHSSDSYLAWGLLLRPTRNRRKFNVITHLIQINLTHRHFRFSLTAV